MKAAETKGIHEWSPTYHRLKKYVDIAFRCYYKVSVEGIDKIPFDEPLIFVVNHQNALMDALALLTVRTWQPVFLSRSDIFKNPTQRKILTFFKMLPVYRMRDGFNTLQQNDDTFNKTAEVLKNHNGLIILPEGSHLGIKKLRPLKKGFARIAFQVQEASVDSLRIKIVPVGLDFADYKLLGSPLLIRFGEPVSVEPFMNVYQQNQARGINLLTDTVRQAMQNEIIHIEDEENHEAILGLLHLLASLNENKATSRPGSNKRFEREQRTTAFFEHLQQNNNDLYRQIIAETNEVVNALRQNGLNASDFINPRSSMIVLFFKGLALGVGFPAFVYGFVNNLLPVALIRWRSNRFKDHHFIPSARFALGLVAFPIFWMVQTLVLGASLGFGWVTLAYLVTLPISAGVLYLWRKQVLILFKQIKFRGFSEKSFPLFLRLPELNQTISSFER